MDRAAFRLLARYRGEEDKPVSDKASASSVSSLARAAFSSAATTEAKPSRPPPPSGPPSDLRAWALLEISHMMTIVMRCSWWMSDEQVEGFIQTVNAVTLTTPDERAQRAMVLAQVHTHRGRWQLGLDACAVGLSEESELTPREHRFGSATDVMRRSRMPSPGAAARKGWRARQGVKEASLNAITKHSSNNSKYIMAQHVAFKTARLKRSLGLMIKDAYESISIAAGYRASITVQLTNAGQEAEWDWALEGYDVDFSATFTDVLKTKKVTVVAEARHSAKDGPVEGRFVVPYGNGTLGGGTLRLEWSNYFSYLRSKSVNYRLQLAGWSHALGGDDGVMRRGE